MTYKRTRERSGRAWVLVGWTARLPIVLLVACAHGPTIEDAIVVSAESWAVLDQQVSEGVVRKSAAIALWREMARCGKPDEIKADCDRAYAAGRDLANFVAKWDAISIVVDVVLVLWRGDDPKAVITDVAPDVLDQVLSTVKGREAEAVRDALVEARRIAREVW